MIDSHCHVAGPEYDADRPAVLDRARAAGVEAFVVVASEGDVETNRRVVDLCEREEDCLGVVGIHPHHAANLDDALLDAIRRFTASPEIVAIGETGLDFHYDHSPREVQADAFRRFLALAREVRLPVVIHSRAAANETLAILRETPPEAGVFHCFTYDAEVAREVLDLGLSISFSGIVTFRNADDIRAAARIVPDDRLLVETDSPFLAPEPKRGGRNEPARVADVVAGLARALDRPPEEIADVTARNTRLLFRR